MGERKTGFEACKECFEGEDTIDISLCRMPSDGCPDIPKDMADNSVLDYLQRGILGLSIEVDMVDHPPHYNNHPSGIECIEVTEHMSFNIGNAVKYLWRVDEKLNTMEDINKAIWYLNREKLKRTKEKEKNG